jgi:MoxR-like ATPase
MKAARAHALLRGLPYLTHEDIQSVALPVLGHRLILQPEAEMEGRQVGDIVKELIQAVPVLKS